MTTISTGAKVANSQQTAKQNTEEAVASPIERLLMAILSIGLQWLLSLVKTKSIIIEIMMVSVRIVVLVLFFLLLLDVFYLFGKGKSIFQDLFQFKFSFGKDDDESDSMFFRDDESLKYQFSKLIMTKSQHGKETYQIEGSTEPPMDMKTIKENMNVAHAHLKERGKGKGGTNLFTYRKWTFYYNCALQLAKEREAFYADGTHKIFVKDKDGQSIVFEGTYKDAIDGAMQYLKQGYPTNKNVLYYRFPQAETSNEFRQISFGTIYEAEKIDNRTQTVIKNTFETWK